MIDLKNTYIENDKGELRDLYLSECNKQGFDITNGDKCTGKFIEVIEVTDIGKGMFVYSTSDPESTSKKITLADLKPRTRTEYTSPNYGMPSDFLKAHESGVVFVRKNGHEDYSGDLSWFDLCQCLANGFVIRVKVECEITWQEEVKSSTDAIALNCTIAHMIDFAPDKLIEISHLVASMTDKPE